MKAESFDDLYRKAEAREDYWLAGTILDFTEAVTEVMAERGMSRSELARRLGCSPAYVTKLLRGNVNFTLASMTKLARALEVELRIDLLSPERQRYAWSAPVSEVAEPSARYGEPEEGDGGS